MEKEPVNRIIEQTTEPTNRFRFQKRLEGGKEVKTLQQMWITVGQKWVNGIKWKTFMKEEWIDVPTVSG